MPENRTIQSPWGFFKLSVKQDADDPRKLEVVMHMRIEKVRVEKKDFDEFVRFHKAVSKAYRVWLELRADHRNRRRAGN